MRQNVQTTQIRQLIADGQLQDMHIGTPAKDNQCVKSAQSSDEAQDTVAYRRVCPHAARHSISLLHAIEAHQAAAKPCMRQSKLGMTNASRACLPVVS